MATFSWSDAFHAALNPCLSCIRSPPPSSDPHQQHRRYSDLERLLANDSTASLDHDADALSLHSNAGRGGTRRKKSVFPKSITLFGYHLFGRPPIHLPEDEPSLEPSRPIRPPHTDRVVSTASLDPIPDAAPLDADAIQARANEEAERAERKKRRREKREAKRAALALAMQNGGNEGEGAFEGFQGSGPVQFGRGLYSDETSSASGSGSGYSRPRITTQQPEERYMDDVDGDADGDFDALAYSRRAPRGTSANGSDSRSRTSASQSQGPLSPGIASYNHQALSSSPMPHSPLSPHHDPSITRQKKHKKTKSSRTGSSKKSGSSAASFSVPSPSADGFPHEPAVAVAGASEGQAFEGFPDDLQELPTAHAIATFPDAQVASPGLPSPGLASPATPFPSREAGAALDHSVGLNTCIIISYYLWIFIALSCCIYPLPSML
ncbi:unnamed protein product [Peniophora sp. CBMAI 1063]|nr:unnamed protein product [Peniophora sp. CBMAI 1063]